MIIFTHPACLTHHPGPEHPERPARLEVILKALSQAHGDLDWRQAPAAKLGDLRRVHSEEHLEAVMAQDFSERRALDQDTFVCPHSRAAALHAAGAVIAAIDAVMNGQDPVAFCAVRPPGHHATRNVAMGFCLLNNVAIGAAYACERHGLERVAIIDFDVHHGNGTQDIFADDSRIAYFSSHESGLFPYSGSPAERGVGNIMNALLPPGSGSFDFRNLWEDRIFPVIEAFQPQLLMISAGFDAHRNDPLADIMLETEDFTWITQRLCQIAKNHTNGRIVSVLEGGYDLDALRETSTAHVAALRQTMADN